MSRHRAYLTRMFGQDQPQPVPGCGKCAQLAEARDKAMEEWDRSAVSDANVLIREHLERAHG